jgi:hypothetical protein
VWSAASVLVCALSIQRLEASPLPPIESVKAAPSDVSTNAEAFTTGTSNVIDIRRLDHSSCVTASVPVIYPLTMRFLVTFPRPGEIAADPQRSGERRLRILVNLVDAPAGSHLRTDNRSVAAAIQTGLEQSRTFKRLVDAIDRTDGIVYVARGTCGHEVRACLVLEVTPSGPNRLLRILVDARKVDSDLIGSIGHELQHAVEVLSEPRVTNNLAIYNFYQRVAPTHKGTFETEAAIQAGLNVLAELRDVAKRR